MKHVKKSVLLWYSAREMYSLVTTVTEYPQFLPWCSQAEVVTETDLGPQVRLTMSIAGLQHAFTTLNRHVEDRAVRIELIDGPFSSLDGHWQFLPLVGRDNAPEQACKVELELRYAFASKALEAAVSPVFDRVANTLVESFIRRAEQVYGHR